VLAAAGVVLATMTGGPAVASEPAPAAPPADIDRSAAAAAHDWNLGLFAGAGVLGSPGATGGAFLTGLRLALGRHFAASVDLGYGLITAPPTIQDRWWVIPSAALVVPVGPVRLDVGAGVGVGTSSGYLSWAGYDARPFTPVWHATVPAVRAHVTTAIAASRGLDLFARADVASLVSAGSPAGATDATWFALWIGVQPRLF
jgi:hypothetical protein